MEIEPKHEPLIEVKMKSYEEIQLLKDLLFRLNKEKDRVSLRKVGSNSNLMNDHCIISEAFLLSAVKLGLSEASTDLGVLYNHYFEIPKFSKGFNHYLKAAKSGDARAIRLYLRDSRWFNFNRGINEIIKLGLQYDVSDAIMAHARRLLKAGKIVESIAIFETAKHRDPNALIEIAFLYNEFLQKGDTALTKLKEFGKYWYKKILIVNPGLGDNDWFYLYNLSDHTIAERGYKSLSGLIKKSADVGDIESSFVYALFLFTGICMSSPNETESKLYLNQAIAGGIPNAKKIKKAFDDANYEVWIEDLSDEETDEYPQADTERKQME
jgi:TPR repeat protein